MEWHGDALNNYLLLQEIHRDLGDTSSLKYENCLANIRNAAKKNEDESEFLAASSDLAAFANRVYGFHSQKHHDRLLQSAKDHYYSGYCGDALPMYHELAEVASLADSFSSEKQLDLFIYLGRMSVKCYDELAAITFLEKAQQLQTTLQDQQAIHTFSIQYYLAKANHERDSFDLARAQYLRAETALNQTTETLSNEAYSFYSNMALTFSRGQDHIKEAIEYYQKAADIYTHPYSPQMDGVWAEPIRQSLARKYEQVLLAIAGYKLEQNQHKECINYCHMVLEIEPCQEQAFQYILQAWALSENRTNLIRAYEDCKNNLSNYLNIHPSKATTDLYKRLVD